MQRNRLVIIICLGLVGSVVQAASQWVVSSAKGDVQVKPRSAAVWTAPVRDQQLGLTDSVVVGKGAELVLLNKEQGTVYRWNKPVRTNVMQLRKMAEKEADTMLEALSKQLWQNLSGQTQQLAKHDIYGGTVRTDEQPNFNDSLACLILSLDKVSLQNLSSAKQDIILKKITHAEDGTISFAVVNQSTCAYCCNVLVYDNEHHTAFLRIVPSLELSPACMVVPPQQTLALPMYRYANNPAYQYYLLLTKSIFSPAEVQGLLNYPETMSCTTQGIHCQLIPMESVVSTAKTTTNE